MAAFGTFKIERLALLREKMKRSTELAAERSASPELVRWHSLVSSWQARRLEQTYQDLIQEPRYRPAIEFFLSDLYGPQDLSQRDHDIERALPKLVLMFPDHVVETVIVAFDLHVTTQELDRTLVRALAEDPCELDDVSADRYTEAFRGCNNYDERKRQIELIGQLGRELDKIVFLPFMYQMVRLTRIPAQLAGFGVVQSFLERGFFAFRRMGGADEFLDTIERRELQMLNGIYAGDSDPSMFAGLPAGAIGTDGDGAT